MFWDNSSEMLDRIKVSISNARQYISELNFSIGVNVFVKYNMESCQSYDVHLYTCQSVPNTAVYYIMVMQGSFRHRGPD